MPSTIPLAATAVATVPAHHRLTIRKSGDDEAYLPVEGARFAVAGHTVDAGEPIDLAAGRYHVTETTAPHGYATAGPWDVDLTAADATLDVVDHAVPGSAKVSKTDSLTGRPLAGAHLLLQYDRDHDGQFETDVAAIASRDRPDIVDHLRPGTYRLSEAAPPPGYRPRPVPPPSRWRRAPRRR